MVDDSVLSVGHSLFHFVVHQVAWKFAGWTCAAFKAPADLIIFAAAIHFNDPNTLLRFKDHIAKKFAAACDEKVLSGKLWNAKSR